MAGKKLAEDSIWNKFDVDGDGEVTDEEIARGKEMLELELKEEKADAHRQMAWFALIGMLLYPFAVVLAVVFGVDKAADILGDMASVYFVAIAGLVAAYFGASAIMSKK